MKAIILSVLILVVWQQVHSQQRPQYTQYIFNSFILNPALAGIENYTDVKVGYRSQWEGLHGAPETSYISIHTPIGKKFINGSSTSVPEGGGTNPNDRSYLQNYMASEPHHGVGFHAVSDKSGPISRIDVNAAYAYHLGISADLNLALGVAAGFSKIDLDQSLIDLEEDYDPAVAMNSSDQFKPGLSAGLWLYGARYFVGASVQQLLPQPLGFSDDTAYDQGKEVPHVFVSAGYKVYLGDDFAVIPSLMAKFVSPVPVSVDINMKAAYRDKFWVGGSYRKADAFSAMAGFYVGSFMNLGYSYDFTTSSLNKVSNGSHEIVLGVFLNNRYRVGCPQRSF